MRIVLFEIEDQKGKFITSFNSARAVEDFFLYLPSTKDPDEFNVLGFDESGYLVQTWYAPDVQVGNFIKDVENYEKRNNQKDIQQKGKKPNKTFRKDKEFR